MYYKSIYYLHLAWTIPWTGRLVSYSPQDHKELDTTEATQHVHSHYLHTTLCVCVCVCVCVCDMSPSTVLLWTRVVPILRVWPPNLLSLQQLSLGLPW